MIFTHLVEKTCAAITLIEMDSGNQLVFSVAGEVLSRSLFLSRSLIFERRIHVVCQYLTGMANDEEWRRGKSRWAY